MKKKIKDQQRNKNHNQGNIKSQEQNIFKILFVFS